jgi:hypothetical protein
MTINPNSSSISKKLSSHISNMESEFKKLSKIDPSIEKDEMISKIAKRELIFLSKIFSPQNTSEIDSDKIQLLLSFEQIISLRNIKHPIEEPSFDISQLKQAINILGDQIDLYFHLPYEDLITISKAYQAQQQSFNAELNGKLKGLGKNKQQE